jgi:hypothetical protein
MSRGHQARRRRNYGRRQHELHERRLRRETWEGIEFGVEDVDDDDVIALFDTFREPVRRPSRILAPLTPWLAEAS